MPFFYHQRLRSSHQSDMFKSCTGNILSLANQLICCQCAVLTRASKQCTRDYYPYFFLFPFEAINMMSFMLADLYGQFWPVRFVIFYRAYLLKRAKSTFLFYGPFISGLLPRGPCLVKGKVLAFFLSRHGRSVNTRTWPLTGNLEVSEGAASLN
jgi:hypothetical protein